MKPSFLIFWGVYSDAKGLLPLGDKLEVYLELFRQIENRGYDVYICRSYNDYLGNNVFKPAAQLKNGQLQPPEVETISPTCVYDRSTSTHFPQIGATNVVNSFEFKSFVSDKWQTYTALSEYFPNTKLVTDTEDLHRYLPSISTENVVVKPVLGLKGKGVGIFQTTNTVEIEAHITKYPSAHFLIQDFIDTSAGIPGIADSVHDLRLVIINNEIVWCHVRQPQSGKLIANVAQAGSITEVLPEQLPENIRDLGKSISAKLNAQFNNPVFSVDIGLTPQGPKIFELNDTMGFPRPGMQNTDRFLTALTDRLTLTT